MVFHSGGEFGVQEVPGRGLEEIEHRVVVRNRRVRDVDDDLRAIKRVGQTLSGQRIDAGVRRRSHGVVTSVAELLDELRADEARSADDNDLHVGLLCL